MATTTGSSHVYVGGAKSKPGTLGGVFRRAVGDDRWEQLGKGLPEAVNVHAITVHPDNPDIVYLGTNRGPFRSTDRGERWERPAFDEGVEIWSILVHPDHPRRLYALVRGPPRGGVRAGQQRGRDHHLEVDRARHRRNSRNCPVSVMSAMAMPVAIRSDPVKITESVRGS